MKFFKSLLTVSAAVFCTWMIFGQESNTALVDFQAELGHPIKVGDSSATVLVGDVVFHHNGAIIVCDSAVRYSESYMECFDNVIIYNDSMLIYGDRVEYNGNTNIAKVFSPLVKMVDKDVTLYCYNEMEYNTLTSIGKYQYGGTITQEDNLMESQLAIYDSEAREVFFTERVSMMNDEYMLKTDSMGYHFDKELVTFYKKALIWNKEGNFLMADEGTYDRPSDTYTFTKNSYVLTDDQQIWADTLIFNQTSETIWLRNNAQIFDESQNTVLFGDYGTYWGQTENAIMTRNPSILAFNPEQPQDSTFVRGDTIIMHTVNMNLQNMPLNEMQDSLMSVMDSIDTAYFNPEELYADSLMVVDSLAFTDLEGLEEIVEEEVAMVAGPELIPMDTVKAIIPEQPELSAVKTKKELRREEKQLKRAEKRAAREQRYEALVRESNREPLVLDTLRYVLDSTALMQDSLLVPDSLMLHGMDHVQSPDSLPQDSINRIIQIYNNVRIFREDLQGVCDSLISFSIDSTAYMYIDPVLWNEDSQVTSDEMHFYSKDGELDRAEFEGEPLMVEKVTDSQFNQLAGRIMTAFFKKNNISRLEAVGNAQSYYYFQDEDTGVVDAFVTTESSYIHFIFEEGNQLEWIKVYEDGEYAFYPMDKIPDSQSQVMRGFRWEQDRRPKDRYDVSDRMVRPSERGERLTIPKPNFGITENIENSKVLLIENGQWRDRTENIWISPDAFKK